MKMTKRIRAAAVITAVALAGGLLAVPGHSGAATKLRIWVDPERKVAITKVANVWGQKNGVTIEVVSLTFHSIRDALKTVDAATAPDVIVGAHDWVGEMSANGSVLPLKLSGAAALKIPSYALDAFSYATPAGRKVLYGVPVALENIGLVVNTKIARVPTSFADLQAQALAFQKKASGNIGVAVPQGSGGDAYHMYPFFSGLCGYVFGKDAKGNLNPSDIGLGSAQFLANTAQIAQWNKSRFVNSKIDYGTAKTAFLAGKAAFWLTGPWESEALKTSGLRFKIVQVPANKCKSVPFLGVQGFMVTKFAKIHGVESSAKDLVSNFMLGANAQLLLASANGRVPANTDAAARVDDVVLKQFAAASAGGVPMPNIPAMGAVWGELGGAWVQTTKGAGAAAPRPTFAAAARNIRAKIG